MQRFCRPGSFDRVRCLAASNFHTAMSKLTVEGQGFSRTVTLNDGHKMPVFGLGLYKCQQTVEITSQCLQNGYRLLDTAVGYG